MLCNLERTTSCFPGILPHYYTGCAYDAYLDASIDAYLCTRSMIHSESLGQSMWNNQRMVLLMHIITNNVFARVNASQKEVHRDVICKISKLSGIYSR